MANTSWGEDCRANVGWGDSQEMNNRSEKQHSFECFPSVQLGALRVNSAFIAAIDWLSKKSSPRSDSMRWKL